MNSPNWIGNALWDAPANLPALWLVQGWLRLGWGLVLAALVLTMLDGGLRRRGAVLRSGGARGVACAMLLGCFLPGVWSPAYWLGLAFQAPSLVTGALAALVLVRHGVARVHWGDAAAQALAQAARWSVPGVVLGWALLLDSFAVWPVYLYPAGFGVGVPVGLVALVLAPWAWQGGAWRQRRAVLVWVAALLVWALTRLPSGNAWDAVLDPWLMLLCHAVLARQCWICYKKRSC